MAHTFAQLLTHITFSTKGRRPELDGDLRPKLFAYMGGIIRELDGTALIINGTLDHVHLLVSLPSRLAVADAMRVLKTNSSRWVHEKWTSRASFGWQTGYGAFSVSQSNRQAVAEYIAIGECRFRKSSWRC